MQNPKPASPSLPTASNLELRQQLPKPLNHPAFRGLPPLRPIRPRCRSLGGGARPSRLRRHPLGGAEDAVHQPFDGVVLVQLRPVQAEAGCRHLDLGELFGRGVAEAPDTTGGKAKVAPLVSSTTIRCACPS